MGCRLCQNPYLLDECNLKRRMSKVSVESVDL